MSPIKWYTVTVLMLAGIALAPPARAREAVDADWPCIQRKVPEVSAGTIWAGPEIDAAALSWRRIEGLSDLVVELAARGVPIEDAYIEIDKYAEAQADGDRNARLTALFAGLLRTINVERADIISGIERFDRRQRGLAERIKTAAHERADQSDGEARADLDRQILWDTRLYDERNQLLTYVCESPVLLEQRLFKLSRRIMSRLID